MSKKDNINRAKDALNNNADDINNNTPEDKSTIENVGEEKINIAELDADLNNTHKTFTPEQKVGENTNGNGETVIPEEVTPDKVIPPTSTPLSDQVESRGYAKVDNLNVNPANEKVIPEPANTQTTGATASDTGNVSGDGTPKPKEPITKAYAEMSTTEKRKNAEKTAEVLVTNYANIMPMAPKWMAKHNMGKMEALEMRGDIRLSMQINDQGLTIRDYMLMENDKADSVFVVTEPMKDEIREPLIDLLMERGMVATPLQRLGIAIAGHTLTFFKASTEMLLEHRNNMKTFKEFRARERNGDTGENNNGESNNNITPPPDPINTPPINNSGAQHNTQHHQNTTSQNTSVEKIGIDDVLTVQNGGIEILPED